MTVGIFLAVQVRTTIRTAVGESLAATVRAITRHGIGSSAAHGTIWCLKYCSAVCALMRKITRAALSAERYILAVLHAAVFADLHVLFS